MAATPARTKSLVPAAFLALLALGGARPPSTAFAATQESVRDERGWMPDVAERREDLARREDRDIREGEHRGLVARQWWRGVAAAPVQGRLP